MNEVIYWNDTNNLWSNDKHSVKWRKTNNNVKEKDKNNNFYYNLSLYLTVISTLFLSFLLRVVEFYIIYEILSDFTFVLFTFLFVK